MNTKNYLIGLFLLLILVLGSNLVTAVPSASNTILYYTMDNAQVGGFTINDTTGLNNGTSGPTSSYIGGVTGKYLQAINMTGGGGINVTASSSTGLLGTLDNFSVGGWFMPQNDNKAVVVIGPASTIAVGIGSGGNTNRLALYTGTSWVSSSCQVDYNTWNHLVWAYNSNTSVSFYKNGVLCSTNTTGNPSSTSGLAVYILHSNGGNRYDGGVDEFFIMNYTINGSDVSYFYNNSSPTAFQQYPFTGGISNFSITARDIFDSSSLTNFSANVSGTIYTTITGTINTNNLINETNLKNITIFNITQNGGYYNTTYLNYNISTNLIANVSKLVRLYNDTYTNYVSFNNSNYTRNLGYSINYTCPDYSISYLFININGTTNNTHLLTCNNQTSTFTNTYNATIEGAFNINAQINNTIPNNNYYNTNKTFIADLNSPTIVNLSISDTNGFYTPLTNVTLICNDTITPNIEYTLRFNNNLLFYGNRTNNYVQTNQSTLINGYNNATGTCKDFFTNTTDTLNELFYAQEFCLIDEKDNVNFNPNNISSARLYYDDNSTYFDFKLNNVSCTNFTSNTENKLRVELGYNSGLIITRFFDSALLSSPVRVCANKEGTSYYEQLIISASERSVIMKNVYSNCLTAGDYTRFAYQDGFVLRASTISAVYYFYTFINSVQTFLASIDGSIATYINIDTLEFRQQESTINLFPDRIYIEDAGNNETEIYYNNNQANNLNASITITRLDTGVQVFSYDDFTNPNNISIIFDYSALGVNASTIFKLTGIFYKNDGTSSVVNVYFNPEAKTGSIPSGVAFVGALLLTIFGLTLTVSRTTFGWFGLIIIVASIGVLSFGIQTWYTTFLMVMDIIIGLFIGLVMTIGSKNNGVGFN